MAQWLFVAGERFSVFCFSSSRFPRDKESGREERGPRSEVRNNSCLTRTSKGKKKKKRVLPPIYLRPSHVQMAIHPSAIHLLFLLRCKGLWWEERLSLNATFRRLYRDIMRTGCCCSGAVGATLLHHRNGKSLFFRCDDDDFLFYVGLLRVDGYKPHGMLLPFCVCCRVSLSLFSAEGAAKAR